MIRTLFFLLFSLSAFANELGLENVAPEDQALIDQNKETLLQVKAKLTQDQFQNLYNSGEMIRLIKMQPNTVQQESQNVFSGGGINPTVLENIKNNPFKGKDPKEVMQMIEMRSQGTRLGVMMKKFPRMKTFMAHWMTHEDALPRFARILGKKKQLINVGIFSIIIFLFMLYVIERWTEREPLMFVRMFKRWLGRMGSLWLCVFLFYFVFRKDIGPTWQLVKKYLLFKGS